VSATAVDLVAFRAGVEASLWERLYRLAPMTPGDRVSVRLFDATVLAVEDGWPTRVRFDFRGLDDICFLEWREGSLTPRPLPAVGAALDLPFERGVLVR
jgi:hypothetical protein